MGPARDALSLSSNSTKEFFSNALGGTGTLNSPSSVPFANGVGTATDYYGDESSASPTHHGPERRAPPGARRR